MKTQDIEYRDGDLVCHGFAADSDKPGKRPAILVVHEAWGLGEHAIARTQKLAELGYVAFAADMYGGRKQVTTIEEARGILGELRQNPPKLRARARAALDAMKQVPNVDTSRLGGIGFCFGGATVLELARDGADLKGVVSFHGALETTAPAQPGAVKASVLVCHGADDPLIPEANVTAFQDEMRKAGADWQMISYGGTVHSFTNVNADGSIAPGILYNKRTDERSWRAMKDFFAEVFA